MKKIFITLTILFFCIPQFLFGQHGWVKEITGLGNKRGDHVINTQDGNIAFTVSTTVGLGSGLGAGSYLAKSDVDGNIIWIKKFSNESHTWLSRQVLSTNDNGYLIQEPRFHPPSGINMPYLIKLDESGEELWSQFYWFGVDSTINTRIMDIVENNDGGFYITGHEKSDPPITYEEMYIRKVDSNFNEIWTIEKPNAYLPLFLSKFDGDEIAVLSQYYDGSTITNSVIKLDQNGNEIFEVNMPMNQSLDYDLRSLSDGGITIHCLGGGSNANVPYLTRLDNSGNILWEKNREEIIPDLPFNVYPLLHSPTVVSDGYIYVSSYSNLPVLGFTIVYLVKLDLNGEMVWYELLNAVPSPSYSVSFTALDDNCLIGMANTDITDTYLYKTNAEGKIYPNQIIGKVGRDDQPNCLVDSSELKLKNWVISAQHTDNTYYTFTDTSGNYQISLDTGDYILSIHPPNNLWNLCENDIDISVDSNSIIENDFPIEASVICPSLVVNSAFPRARPCFDNRYNISYHNQGTDIASNAYIEIEVDPKLTYSFSSINLTSQIGNTYIFNLGDLDIGEYGNFYIDYFLDCNTTIGESICVESHIYPDSTCLPDPNWNGAFIEVDAYCQDSIIKFYLENTGIMDMPTSKEYIVVEDAILLMSNDFQLLAGEQDSFSVTSNDATFIMAAEQVENAPGSPYPTTWIEGCTTNGSSNFSIGFVNQFSLGDDAPYLDIDCTIASNSYDPNDKQGYPLGYGDEHFIRPNTDLEYLIRFQNTGTDTAFTVVIRDTIAPELDIPSIQVGAASHDYSWRIYGENILGFTFNVIMLPDSNVNEPASHGFVEFKISQKEDLPIGTVIKNKAAIYFDYNDPIITNESFHTLGENFITVSTQRPIAEDYSLLVRPNPLQDFAIFEMKKQIKNGLFELYDVTGKLAWQQKFNGSEFRLKRNNLNAGIYFYKISENGNAINSGKVIIN